MPDDRNTGGWDVIHRDRDMVVRVRQGFLHLTWLSGRKAGIQVGEGTVQDDAPAPTTNQRARWRPRRRPRLVSNVAKYS